jgi:PKD repeat protein
MFGLGNEVIDVGDFDGDGNDDISVFIKNTKPSPGVGDVYVSLSSGTSFKPSKTWHNYFSIGNEFPTVGDIDGDGATDILTFIRDTKPLPTRGNVYASLSNRTTFGASFTIKNDFATDGGIVCVGDFNGDNFDDIVTFENVPVGIDGEVTISTSSPSNNEDMLPIVYALSCKTAKFHFLRTFYLDKDGNEWASSVGNRPAPNPLQISKYDKDAWAENMLVKYDVGAIGYVGATEVYEYGGELLDKYFFEAYHVSWKPTSLGFMWSRAMDEFVSNKVEPDAQDYYAFVHIHKVLLFGDPSLRVGGLPYLIAKFPSGAFEFSTTYQTNSQISDLEFQELNERISFTVEGQTDRIGFCNVTIPLSLLTPIAIDPVLCDGQPIQSEVTQNLTHSFIYFTYPHSSHEITILGDLGPTSEFDWSPKPQDEGLPVAFSDLSTSSPDTIVSWNWDFDDSSSSLNQNPLHTYLDDGAYNVLLTVTDDDGSSDSNSHMVTINNVAPITNAGPSQSVNIGETLTVTGSFTDQGILDTHTAIWDWGDGSPTESGTVIESDGSGTVMGSHEYSECGVFTATLTVTDDEGDSHTDAVTITVLPLSTVTDSSFCPNFDKEAETEGTQFRLIFSPDLENDPSLYKIPATNPGQLYYNVFYVGDVESGESFVINIPYPFVTKGASPVHIYDDSEILESGCFSYIGASDITHQFEIIIVENIITINPETSLSGVTWITIHLDYDLKKTGGYEMHLYNDDEEVWRAHAIKDLESIFDLTNYVFTVTGLLSDSQNIQNRNEFKKIRGIAGHIDGAGLGTPVYIYGGSIDTLVFTDDDGWYGLEFKHKGKASEYTIDPENIEEKKITLKPAHFVEVNFP